MSGRGPALALFFESAAKARINMNPYFVISWGMDGFIFPSCIQYSVVCILIYMLTIYYTYLRIVR